MSVLKTRSRQVSFRLSEDEYQILCQFCVSMGARSISDVARSAVCDMIGLSRNGNDGPLALDLRIRQLNQKIENLADLVKSDGRRAAAKPSYGG
jgi:hypothetical protein